MAERSAEQHSTASRSTDLLDSMRKRFSTPAAEMLAASRDAMQPGTVLAASALETPHPLSGATVRSSLKENLSTELNRSSTVAALFGAAAPTPAPAPTRGPALGGSAAGGSDSLLQQASSMFLQQVEEMRRKYTAEVERLRVRPREHTLSKPCTALSGNACCVNPSGLHAAPAHKYFPSGTACKG